MQYSYGELFCGAGGMALGASLAGFLPVWGIDSNQFACETHRKNLEGVVLCADVREVTFAELPPVDCLAFGFPCNDFSAIGKQRGLSGKYGPLYKECVRALKELQPRFFVAENVERLATMQKQAIIKQIVQDFEAAGYKVYFKVLHFERLGLAQRRHRVIFVGVRNDLSAVPSFPKESDTETASSDILGKPYPAHCKNMESVRTSERDKAIFPFIPQGKNYSAAYGIKGCPIFPCGATFRSIHYRRLAADQPALTVIADSSDRLVHYSEDRWLTNRENARLQSFPDDFEFVGSEAQVRAQIGMAVPPQGIKLVFKNVIEMLESCS